MLEDLEILNGQMTPKFDKYNDIYTVEIDYNIESLVIDYKLAENTNISIYGNEDLKVGENIIYLELVKDDIKKVYTIYANKKEEVKSSFSEFNSMEKVEVPKKTPQYVAPLIGASCFLIILITFCLLFAKRKKHK